MVCRRRCMVAIAVLTTVFAGPDLASATMRAYVTSTQRGWIGLRVAAGRPDSRVQVREGQVRRVAFRLDRRGRAVAPRVAAWRCASRERTLVIDDGRAGRADVSTRTP